MTKYKYSWTRKYSVPAQVVGEILQSLPSRSADELLKVARSRRSPIHDCFEWDDSVAAHQHRMNQARTMINSLEVEVVVADRKPSTVMAFIKQGKSHLYVPTLEADQDDLTAAEAKCLDHMRQFKSRWKGIALARSVIAEISAIEVQTARRRKRKTA